MIWSACVAAVSCMPAFTRFCVLVAECWLTATPDVYDIHVMASDTHVTAQLQVQA